jgi:hypothetical protein
VRSGYELWANPGMVVDHEPRPTLAGWVRNVFLYGRGRSFFLKRHPEEIHLKFFAPAAVVAAYLAAGLWGMLRGTPLSPVGALAAIHLGGIALLLVAETRRQGGGLRVWMAATIVAWLTHLAYGAGFLYELPWRRDRFVR